jgi:hypothetical protein
MSEVKRSLSLVVVLALMLVGCSREGSFAALGAEGFVDLSGQSGRTYAVHATGAQEVPATDSRAQGQAVFRLNAVGTELSYRLIVANIENVTMAHIHLAPAGSNGPVVAWLYPDRPPAQLIPGRSQGVLAEGVLTSGNLVGPLAGAVLSDLLDALEAGNAYVNIHTSQYPPGEIRGNFHAH